MVALALCESRRSSVTHHSQAWVSRSVGMPAFTSAERIAGFLHNASREASTYRGRETGHQRRDRSPALGDDDRRSRLRHLIQRLQTPVFELAGGDRLHDHNIAIAIWLYQCTRSHSLEQGRRTLPAADTHRHYTVAGLPPLHLVGDRPDQPRAVHAERMADRNRAAVVVPRVHHYATRYSAIHPFPPL